ncbi:MAG: hypothetical protein GXP54_07070, partial [Deltaproteobacteria bacterium]|nr:hypothetical protein [Deltaproteobacteria bacterium]
MNEPSTIRIAVLVVIAAAGIASCGNEGAAPDNDVVVADAKDATVDGGDSGNGEDVQGADLDTLTVLTFNVLCSFCDPSFDPWEDRVQYHADIIRRHNPDLVGLQELLFLDEVEQYLALNPEYSAVYYESDDPEAPFPIYPDETI